MSTSELRISEQQLEMRTPDYKRDPITLHWYLNLANRILDLLTEEGVLAKWPEAVKVRAALGVTGYMQDIVADGGPWRSFINENRRLYGRTLPFYKTGENYVDYELNAEDVRFMLWYSLAMNYDALRLTDPLDEQIRKAAVRVYDLLEEVYEDAPVDESFTMPLELEMYDEADREQVLEYGNWLFMYCYLMSPAYSMTLLDIMQEPEMQNADVAVLQKRIHQSMAEDPTGPLALYLGEWMHLIVDGRVPQTQRLGELLPEVEPGKENPTYLKFVAATEGSPIAFFKDYRELNSFFITALGWAQGEEHLPQMKTETDFVLLVNPAKGMLLARGIAKNIALPSNPLYDREYASKHAISMLTERGRCPADLLAYLFRHDALPDACFPGGDTQLVKENFDFIARLYLQLYYRGD